MKLILSFFLAAFLFTSCSTIPEGATAITPFDKTRYLGKWYEIARFDYKFERGLNNVSATYSANDDGTIKVMNRGYDYEKKEWKDAEGKAKFAGDENVAALRVSFFGPFYAPYNVIALDDQYQYALIAGKNVNYMWILSRQTTIPDDVKQRYLKQSHDLGFDTSQLIWVEHDMK